MELEKTAGVGEHALVSSCQESDRETDGQCDDFLSLYEPCKSCAHAVFYLTVKWFSGDELTF